MKQLSYAPVPVTGRLSKADRRRQLLAVARAIVHEEGVERLTLGHLALRAGVSKPITYEHFGTRGVLLAELYKALDQELSQSLREGLQPVGRHLKGTADGLATAWIHCSADMDGEWHAVGAALTGCEEMAAVHRELIDGYVQLFASVLTPHSTLAPDEMQRRCVGLVGAGDALSKMMIDGHCSEQNAAAAFSSLIQGALRVV